VILKYSEKFLKHSKTVISIQFVDDSQMIARCGRSWHSTSSLYVYTVRLWNKPWTYVTDCCMPVASLWHLWLLSVQHSSFVTDAFTVAGRPVTNSLPGSLCCWTTVVLTALKKHPFAWRSE